jgi:uncharacterized protein with HEPN domain
VAQYSRDAQSNCPRYFDINLDVVWDTVQTALPQLIQQLSNINKSE